MTVTISNAVAGQRTITYTKTIASAKMLDLGEKAAHYLFDVGYGNHGTLEAPRLWAVITPQEKLDILDKYLSEVLRDAARSYHINDALAVARKSAKLADFEMEALPK